MKFKQFIDYYLYVQIMIKVSNSYIVMFEHICALINTVTLWLVGSLDNLKRFYNNEVMLGQLIFLKEMDNITFTTLK